MASVLGTELHGFLDTRAGYRTQEDPTEDEDTLGETRLQIDAMRYFDAATMQLRADFLYDWALDEYDIDLEEGDGWIDLREANILFSPVTTMDIKAGRQILTWGVGDLVFINDLFPKDWQSFFSGRDEEYLKAPSDAFFASFFPGWASIDVAYSPRFDADRYITGERFSFFSPAADARVGQDALVAAERPDDVLSDDEIAARISGNVAGMEWALYGYHGFWKSPAGSNPDTGRATFPELQVVGASARGPIGTGIAKAEAGFYGSADDRDGDNPFVRNSEWRALLGYDRELAHDLTGGLQYYVEVIEEYGALVDALPDGLRAPDEDRHLLTMRLTQLLMSQNLTLSLFAFYSPSDEDAYLRPAVSYKATDEWMLTAGGNIFLGREAQTFFGQFEDNSNLYAGARYSF